MMTSEQQQNAMQATLVSNALVAQQVGDAAAGQLTQLWKDDFLIATDKAGRYQLLTRTGEAAADLIKARLGSPEFAHFVVPQAAAPAAPAPVPVNASAIAAALSGATDPAGRGLVTDHHGNPLPGRSKASGVMGFGRS